MERPGAITLHGKPVTLIGPELKPGDQAPDFRVIDLSSKPVSLADTGNMVRIFSVLPSLDTPVCDAQTKRFNDESVKLPGVVIYTVSVDLPFAQKRWCHTFAIDHIRMLSDHRDTSFGIAYGTLIKELRIEARAIFVVNRDNTLRHVEYVKDVAEPPDFHAALAAAQAAAGASA